MFQRSTYTWICMVPLILGSAATLAQSLPSPRDIAAKARAATVQIRAIDGSGALLGQGTGFFVGADGIILTNVHVIQDASSLQIETSDGEVFDNVFYVTSDVRRDTAILKIPMEGASILRLGDDEKSAVGSKVYVMGNPLGQTATFSDGLVSARRTVEGVSVLQITAPISPGSSGGAVMNEEGDVIGIATMILNGGQNLNFAVPVRYVSPMLSMGERPQRFSRSLIPPSVGGLPSVSGDGTRRPGGESAAPSVRESAGNRSDQSSWEREVRAQLFTIEKELATSGLVPSHDVYVGWLDAGKSREVTAEMEAGLLYGIAGVCDSDCGDVDLRVYDSNGTLLDADTSDSDLAVVTFTARRTGSHKIRITMASCAENPCSYGLESFTTK